jgi:hypothetical protein
MRQAEPTPTIQGSLRFERPGARFCGAGVNVRRTDAAISGEMGRIAGQEAVCGGGFQ